MREDILARQIEGLQQRIAAFQKHADQWTPELLEPFQTTLGELYVALEELLVAEESLLDQNELLVATQQELELERRRFADLFESAPDSYLLTDARGVIQEANYAVSTLLARPRGFLIGKPLALFVAQQRRQQFRALLDQLCSLDGVQEWEVRLQPRPDTFVDVGVRVAALRDHEGKLVSLQWLLRDMTARKQAEEQIRQLNAQLEQRVVERTAELMTANAMKDTLLLREQAARQEAEAARYALAESEARYRTIAQLISDFAYAFRIEADGTPIATWLAGAFTQITGYDPEELLNVKPRPVLFHPDDLPIFHHFYEQLLAGKNQVCELRIVTKSGDVRWLRDHGHAEVDPATGRVARIIGAVSDITERKRAEEALQVSEERFRIALADSPVTVFHQDRDLRYTWVYNPYPPAQPEQIVGHTDVELFQPQDAARLTAIKQQVMATGVGTQSEVLLSTPGTPMWFDLRVEPLRDASGAIVGIACAATNITNMKQAEATIRRQAQLLEETFDAIFVREVAGTIIYWNSSAEKLYGFSKAEAIGRICYDLLRTTLPGGMAVFEEVLEAAGRWEGELQHTTRDGRTIIVSSRQVLVREDDGSRYVIDSNYDITERKRVEEQLRESEARFRVLADSAPVLIWMSGIDQQWIYVNKPWLVFTGHSFEQELGMGWLDSVHPDDRASCSAIYNAAFEAREEFRVECRLRRFDGEYRWILGSGIPRFAPDGAFEGFIGSSIDITDRKRMEHVRNTLLERLVVAQEDERRRLSYELHDELGRYLTALQLGLKTLQETVHSDPIFEHRLKQLQELTTTLGRDLHTLARQLRPAVLDDLGLCDALENFVEEWSTRYSIAAAVQCLGLDRQRLPMPFETTIYRVVQEALTNIARHAEAQRVSVIVERRSQHVQLIVEDDGQGFDAEAILGIPDTQRGLGLIGMQERVVALGGSLTIESFPGRGTTIFVRIPISTEPEEDPYG